LAVFGIIMIDNKTLSRFERAESGHTAYADYKLEGDVLHIRLVFAPEELRGSGAAGRLMADIAAHAATKNLKILPLCGYAAAWMRKHPEYNGLLA
jgi:uncharacterized protein